MSAQHTPGPWRLSSMWPNRVCGVRTDDEGSFVADCDANGLEKNAQDTANARLIAAAPELLEALDILRDCLEDRISQLGHDPADDARVKLARSAIAKATGEQQ